MHFYIQVQCYRLIIFSTKTYKLKMNINLGLLYTLNKSRLQIKPLFLTRVHTSRNMPDSQRNIDLSQVQMSVKQKCFIPYSGAKIKTISIMFLSSQSIWLNLKYCIKAFSELFRIYSKKRKILWKHYEFVFVAAKHVLNTGYGVLNRARIVQHRFYSPIWTAFYLKF